MRYELGLLAFLFLGIAAMPAVAQQERTIRGTVVDSVSGGPVDFPQVAVRGTTIGTVGDENGNFVLRGVPGGDITLAIQRIGYKSKQVPVPAGRTEVRIRLLVDYLQVEELVVTGRATRVSRRNLANAVETVSGEELDETPQQTVDKALQGRVTGAVVASNSGAPGGGLQLNLRGSSSINAAAEPLYVIDGVIVSNIAIPSFADVLTEASGGSNPSSDQDALQNRVADLNPEDIESIEILKGASAAAIYGSKASNGVVIITTKRGQAGPPELRLSLDAGTFDLSNKLGSRVYETEAEAVNTWGEGAAEFYEEGVVFDHEQEIAGRNALSWEGSGSVSGGAEGGLQYFGSALWKNDEGIIRNTGFEKQSARANLQTSLGEAATLNINTNVIHSLANRGLTNNDNAQVSYYMVFPATPNFVDLGDRDAEFFPPNPFGGGDGSNPLQTAALVDKAEDVWRLMASGNVDLSLVEGDRSSFDLLVNGGVDYFQQENRIFSPPELFFEDNDGLLGTVVLSKSDNLNLNVGANGVWEYRPSDALTTTTSVGVQYERRDLDISRIVGEDLTGGKDKADAATQVQIVERREQVEDFGFYVQEEVLALDDRLLLTGSVRFDQSSANGDDSKVFVYPKAAASYRLTDLDGFLDEAKLRVAFGQTGNQPLYGQEFTDLLLDRNIEGIPGFQVEGTVGDPDLSPERQTEIEGGVDLTAWDGRATLELTGYHQRITDLILERTVAPSTGFEDQFFNGGKLRNWGIETSLGLTPITTRDFTWVSRTSFYFNRSEVTELPVPAFEADAGFALFLGGFFIEEGSSLTQIVGTDPSCETPETRPDCRSQAGLAKLGNSEPDFTMTFTNDFELGSFRLYSLFEWRQGQEVVNLTTLLYDLNQNSADFEAPDPDDLRDARDCHPDCFGQERVATWVEGFALPFVQPASFLKAREISLTWEVPAEMSARIFGGFFDRIRLRASGRNLFTITPYEGLDPEVSNFANQQVGRSIDVAPFPPSRSFFFGVDLRL